jgi:hypothetical protein
MSITPSPIIPLSLSMSVVGVSQSHTWNASRRSLFARSIWAFSFRIPPDVIDVDGDSEAP